MPRRTINKNTIILMQQARKNGLTLQEIANKYQCSVGTACYHTNEVFRNKITMVCPSCNKNVILRKHVMCRECANKLLPERMRTAMKLAKENGKTIGRPKRNKNGIN